MIQDLVNNAVESIRVHDKPYFSYGTWPEEAQRLDKINELITRDDIKFPLVFLREPIRESFDSSEKYYRTTLFLYIIGRTDIKKTPKYRHENEMPALRTIETSLRTALKHNSVEFEDFDREEVKAAELEINTPVNFIELEIPAKYLLNCLT